MTAKEDKTCASSTSQEEFDTFIHLLPFTPYLIPLCKNSKDPNVVQGESWKDEKYKLTVDQARELIKDGFNVGIVATGHDIVIFDLDNPEKYTFSKETLTVKTRSGKLHKYFLNDGSVKNADGKGQYKKCGEVRAEWKYVVCPGSYVPCDTADGDGVYRVIVAIAPVFLCSEELPKEFQPSITDNANLKVSAVNMTGSFRNQYGWSLEDIREHDEKLDSLLKNSDTGYASASEADMATLSKLLYWGYMEGEAVDILQHSRSREKLNREDYLRMTLAKIGKTDTIANHVNVKRWTPKMEKQEASLATATATKEKKGKPRLKDSGLLENGCFEAIYNDGKACFLVLNGGSFATVENVQINDDTFSPKEQKNFPYEPYGIYQGTVPSEEELYWKIREEYDLFIDVEPIWKDVLATCTLLTYQQEKLQTVPYLYPYGDNESGKTTILNVMRSLCYRPMFGITVPTADLFGYLEDSDSIPCILEDEIQGIDQDTDKIKIYKSGYKAGAVVPRTLLTESERAIKYYRTFCFKVCAGEQIPQAKGFNERFLFIPMVEGCPRKEWTDITREDVERLHNLRNVLLKWRMLRRNCELPVLDLPIKGRLKELWKPILQISHGLTVYQNLFKFVEDQKNERLSTRQNTLEGHVVKTVVDLFNESNEPLDYISFQTIWSELRLDLDGKIDDRKPHVMDTSEFFEISKNKIGYRLREVLSGKSKPVREKDPEGKDVIVKAYVFDQMKLRRVARKYGFELVTKLLSKPSSEGVNTSESMYNQPEKHVENTSHTPQELGKPSNLVTDGKDQNLGFPCPYCKSKGKLMFFASDSDLICHINAWHEEPDYVR
jgi:hypothetical protein